MIKWGSVTGTFSLPIVTSGFHGHRIWRGPVSWNGDQATPLRRVIRLDPRGSVCDLLRHHLSYKKWNPITLRLSCFFFSQLLLMACQTFLASDNLKKANSSKMPGFLLLIKIEHERWKHKVQLNYFNPKSSDTFLLLFVKAEFSVNSWAKISATRPFPPNLASWRPIF